MFDGVVELEFAIWVSIFDTGPFKPELEFAIWVSIFDTGPFKPVFNF